MSTRVLEITVKVAHSDPDINVLLGPTKTRSVETIAQMAARMIATQVRQIPQNRVCSITMNAVDIAADTQT